MKTDKFNLIVKVKGAILIPMMLMTLLLIYSFNLHSSESENKNDVTQQEKISLIGKVLDNSNNVIDGVLVKDENSDMETQTDSEGKFKLMLNEATVVHFVKLGFQAQEIEVAESDSNLVVVLLPESNEMIVEGFNIEKKADKDHKWILDSLSSIIDNYPLYVIDDEQKESDFDIKMINPEDVESIEMLDDSNAKDVYGENGQRGAVKITTKGHNPFDIKNERPMQLNKADTVTHTLQDKYEIYKDTMNARNERLRNKKVNEPMDTSKMKIKKDIKNEEWKKDTTKNILKNKEEMQ